MIIQQQAFIEVDIKSQLDEFVTLFPLGPGLKIFPKRSGDKKRTITTHLTREMVHHAYAFDDFAVGLYLPKRGETRFCVIDLDAESAYRNLDAVHRLRSIAIGYGLDLHLMRSSLSGGWHLVGFFAEPVSNIQVATVLQAVAARAGISLASGQCELYPWPGATRRAVRLPGQPGSAWLNPDDGTVSFEASKTSTSKRLSELLSRVQASRVTAADFNRTYNATRRYLNRNDSTQPRLKPKTASRATGKRPKRISTVKTLSSTDRLELGKRYYQDGLTGPGQLNEALFCVGHHLFVQDPARYGYDHPEAREAALLEWVKTKHNGQSRTLKNAGWAAVEHQIRRMTHTPRKKARGKGKGDYKFRNEKRRLEVQFKIQAAITMLHCDDRTATSVSKAELARLAGVTRKALYKHWDLVQSLDEMMSQAKKKGSAEIQ